MQLFDELANAIRKYSREASSVDDNIENVSCKNKKNLIKTKKCSAS